MKYEKIVRGKFIDRPNRFIAHVELGDATGETGENVVPAHVKNTGRCRELLVPGATVYLEDFRTRMGSRKLAFSLIGVEKTGVEKKTDETEGAGGQRMMMVKRTLMVNMDSQAPNKVVMDALRQGKLDLPSMGKLTLIRAEKTYGDSRFDFYLEDERGQKAFMEVKGVTLENHGIASFPDAPTERGVKHINELLRACREGYRAFILFVIQMEGMKEFMPNDKTHPEFGQALRQAQAEGVSVLAWECHVTGDSLTMARPVKVNLTERMAGK